MFFKYSFLVCVMFFCLKSNILCAQIQIYEKYKTIQPSSLVFDNSKAQDKQEISLVPVNYNYVNVNMVPFGGINTSQASEFQSYYVSSPLNLNDISPIITEEDSFHRRILGDITSFWGGESSYGITPSLSGMFNLKAKKLPELDIPQNDAEVLERINVLLKHFSAPRLSVVNSTPARLLHYSLIAGADEIFLISNVGGSASNTGDRQVQVPSMYTLGALCWNISCANRRLMYVFDDHPVPRIGVGFQAQRGEFLATLAFAKIDRNYEIRVDGRSFKVQDLVEWEKLSCSSYSNLSLVAIGLAYYLLDPDETWINLFGERWSLQKILEQESRRIVDWNTADSTDKLLAFTYLLARLKQSPKAKLPELATTLCRTEKFLTVIKKQVWDSLDGTLLPDSLFFNSRVRLATPYMKLYVNGKLLRWLTVVASTEELRTPRMKKAYAELCALVDQLFNSVEDLNLLSNMDEESLAIALQTLVLYRRHLMSKNFTLY